MSAHIEYDANLAAKYNSEARREHPQSNLPYITWLRELGDIAGKSVLDLACGDGHTSRMLAERGAKVVGVDISPEQTSRAKAAERTSPLRIGYVTCDVADLSLGRTFDIVSPSFLFHYAENKEKLLKLIERTVVHLRSGGRMVALSASFDPIVPRIHNASHSTAWEGAPDQEGSRVRMWIYDRQGAEVCNFAYYYWSEETYRSLFAQAGLVDLVEVKHVFPNEWREEFPNWRDLERKNAGVVLTAHKR